MKKLIFALAAFLFVALTSVEAQFNNLWKNDFTVDTLTNADSGEFVFSQNLDYASDIVFIIENEEISGTASNVLTIRQTTTSSGSTGWIETDTVATATATANYVFRLTAQPRLSTDKLLWGYRIKLRAATTGTGVHRVKAYAIGRRLKGF